ncbi:hypothetical protein OH77DRAFT_543932 [Trametes cingulata]|nr:hypothetical protein OH77DRAFT_543932 [Trametes cingulata]
MRRRERAEKPSVPPREHQSANRKSPDLGGKYDYPAIACVVWVAGHVCFLARSRHIRPFLRHKGDLLSPCAERRRSPVLRDVCGEGNARFRRATPCEAPAWLTNVRPAERCHNTNMQRSLVLSCIRSLCL